MESQDRSANHHHDADVTCFEPREFNSEELLGGAKVVLISHHGEVYRLQETRNGKLILTK